MRTTARVLPVLALLAALGACGNEGPADVSAPPSQPDPATAGAGGGGGSALPQIPDSPDPGTGTGGAGGGGVAPPKEEGPPLKLVAIVKNGTVERGEPIPVRVEVQNLGQDPMGIVNIGEELSGGLFVEVNEGVGENGKPALRGYGNLAPATENEVVTTLAPGEMFAAEVDLQPLLSRSPSYDEGEVTFAVLFRGRGKRVSGGQTVWNADGKSVLGSAVCQVDVTQPAWMQGDDEDEDAPTGPAWNKALFYRHGTPNGAKIEKEVKGWDETSLRGLAGVLFRLGSGDAKRSVVAGNALRLLRMAPKAHAALQTVDGASHPAVAMAKAIVAEDASSTPSKERQAAAGVASGRTSHWLRVEDRSEAGAPVVYTLTDDRFLMLTEGEGDAANTSARQLQDTEIEALRKAAADSCLWCWRAVRTTRREGEGTVAFQLGQGPKMSVNLTLPAEEATRDNPFAADLVKALREVRRKDPLKPQKPPK